LLSVVSKNNVKYKKGFKLDPNLKSPMLKRKREGSEEQKTELAIDLKKFIKEKKKVFFRDQTNDHEDLCSIYTIENWIEEEG
jgi:hypothetical protein